MYELVKKLYVVTAALLLTSVVTVSADSSVDAELGEYAATSGVSGNLSSVGSDTLANSNDAMGRRVQALLSKR